MCLHHTLPERMFFTLLHVSNDIWVLSISDFNNTDLIFCIGWILIYLLLYDLFSFEYTETAKSKWTFYVTFTTIDAQKFMHLGLSTDYLFMQWVL